MDQQLQAQYFSMLSDISNDKTEQAKAVLSNILSAKLATQLQQHNTLVAQQNQDNVERVKAIASQV